MSYLGKWISGATTERHRRRIQKQAVHWVVSLNDPTATHAEFVAWQSWLTASSEHARTFAQVQESWRRTAILARIPPNVETPDKIRPPQRTRLYAAPLFWVVAAVAVAAFGLVLTLPWSGRFEQSISTRTGEVRTLRLPDGSHVTLGPQTRLSVRFARNARQLRMEGGEAEFSVTHDPARPFSIGTTQGTVVAVGTEFTVRPTETRLTVTVSRGTVRCDSLNRMEPVEPVFLGAGYRLVLEHNSISITATPAGSGTEGLERGHLEYQDDPLSVVLEDLNRYSSTKVVVGDPGLGDLRYSGTVFTDSLDIWLESMSRVFPVQVRKRGDVYVIEPKEVVVPRS